MPTTEVLLGWRQHACLEDAEYTWGSLWMGSLQKQQATNLRWDPGGNQGCWQEKLGSSSTRKKRRSLSPAETRSGASQMPSGQVRKIRTEKDETELFSGWWVGEQAWDIPCSKRRTTRERWRYRPWGVSRWTAPLPGELFGEKWLIQNWMIKARGRTPSKIA